MSDDESEDDLFLGPRSCSQASHSQHNAASYAGSPSHSFGAYDDDEDDASRHSPGSSYAGVSADRDNSRSVETTERDQLLNPWVAIKNCTTRGAPLPPPRPVRAYRLRQGERREIERWPWLTLRQMEEKRLRAVRTLVINWPASMHTKSAEKFSDFLLWNSNTSRSKATTAIIGIFFAGISQGIPCGSHNADILEGEDDDDAEGGDEEANDRESGNARQGPQRQGQSQPAVKRQKKEDKKPATEVRRYVFRSCSRTGDDDDEEGWDNGDDMLTTDNGDGRIMPMFDVALEELLDEEKKSHVGMRLWIFVYDEEFSFSQLVSQTMRASAALTAAGSASGETAWNRKRTTQAEKDRHEKAGAGFAELDRNFEDTAGFQYKRITDMESWITMLAIHGGGSGVTAYGGVRSCVPNFAEYVGRHEVLEGMRKTPKMGGLHPLSPEYLFNAKRPEALAFGMVAEDGAAIGVCEEQLNVSSYFKDFVLGQPLQGEDWFTFPAVGGDQRPTFFFRLSCENRKTIFNYMLPRPFLGSIVPGEFLTRMFLELKIRDEASLDSNYDILDPDSPHAVHLRSRLEMLWGVRWLKDEDPNKRLPDYHHMRPIQQILPDSSKYELLEDDFVAVRTYAFRKDETTRQNETLMQSMVYTHDMRACMARTAAAMGGTTSGVADSNGNYTIHIKHATDAVREAATNLHTHVVRRWVELNEDDVKFHDRKVLYANSKKAPRDATEQEENQLKEWGAQKPQRLDWFHTVHFKAMRDLTQYYARLLNSSFQMKRDLMTLPAGYRAMYSGLMQGIQDNGGTASVAYSPLLPSSRNVPHGKQLTSLDRTVFGELQSWLSCMFKQVCKISGRDQRLMDEMYLTMFEPYADTTFITIISSEKGRGKSIRAQRLSQIMPPGWCVCNSTSSAKAGMNGNMSPSNGCVVICDEMMSELTKAECDERMEYWKIILTTRSYPSERTLNLKQQDGTDVHATCKIITDHRESYIVCCNKGQCFTEQNQEPTSGKEALIQRTICLFARTETTTNSDDAEFQQSIRDNKEHIRHFRLFTSLCGFVRFMLQKMEWLRPDFAFAELMFREADRMLQDDYGKPPPEPRRLIRRTETLLTLTIMEAVARVYFYKQTAHYHEYGKLVRVPTSSQGANEQPTAEFAPPEWEPGHLWSVIRTLHPTREVISFAWSISLEHSISTSSNGIAVMAAVAEKAGFGGMTGAAPTQSQESGNHNHGTNTGGNGCNPLEIFCRRAPRGIPPPQERDISLPTIFASESSLGSSDAPVEYENTLSRLRVLEQVTLRSIKLRHAFRRMAAKNSSKQQSNTPLQAVQDVYAKGTKDDKIKTVHQYCNALFPTITEATLHYKSRGLIQWAVNGEARFSPVAGSMTMEPLGPLAEYLREPSSSTASDSGSIRYRCKNGSTENAAKVYDMAWAVVMKDDNRGETHRRYGKLAEQLRHTLACKNLDMHKAGIADTLYMLCSSENTHSLPQMPILPHDMGPLNAFVNEVGLELYNQNQDGTQHLAARVNPKYSERFIPRQDIRGTDCDERGTPAIQERLDSILAQGGFPALQPHISTIMDHGPPLRYMPDSGFEVNVVVMNEQTNLTFQSALRCSRLPGCIDRQEKMDGPGKSAIPCLKDNINTPESYGADQITTQSPPETCRINKLAFSKDVVHIAWASEFIERFYDRERPNMLAHARQETRDYFLEKCQGVYPEISIAFHGYDCPKEQLPRDKKTREPHTRLLSLPVAEQRSAMLDKQTCVHELQANPVAQADTEALRRDLSMFVGHEATDEEVEKYRRSAMGKSFMHGIKGDLYCATTFRAHMLASMRERGMRLPNPKTDVSVQTLLSCETMFQARRYEASDSAEFRDTKWRLHRCQFTTYVMDATAASADAMAIEDVEREDDEMEDGGEAYEDCVHQTSEEYEY